MNLQGKYLKDGSGKPWAGQSNDNAPLRFFSNVPKLFESDENLGPAPPIGSKGFNVFLNCSSEGKLYFCFSLNLKKCQCPATGDTHPSIQADKTYINKIFIKMGYVTPKKTIKFSSLIL